MEIGKELFELFQNKKSDYQLYKDIVVLIENYKHEIKGEENSQFYNVLVTLTDSMNNSGYEDRRIKDIEFIQEQKSSISNSYYDFLP